MRWEEYFVLDPTSKSGLRWNTNIYNVRGALTKARVGREAGSLNGQGRWQVGLYGEVLIVHRIIWEMLHGPIPDGMVVDHDNGDGADNSHTNLVLKTSSGNSRNRKKMGSNTSGVTGAGFWLCKGHLQARAGWLDEDGRQQFKTFSVNKYGLLPAFAMACDYRAAIIERLNIEGAGYTGRHGI